MKSAYGCSILYYVFVWYFGKGGSITENSRKTASRFSSYSNRFIRRTSRLFSESFTLKTAGKVMDAFLTSSLNVCGVFFLTFGLYSVAASLLLHYFNSSFAGNVSIFAGAVMALASIPMLFSKDNISTSLYHSLAGSVLCEAVNVRMVTLRRNEITGHRNQGFALGVIAGTLSIALSTKTMLMIILMLFVCGASFALPAVGIVFLTSAFPYFSGRVFVTVTLITLMAYTVKVLRGKRSISFHVSGAVFLIFTAFAAIRTALGPAAADFGAWEYVILLFPYFLAALILKNFRDAVRAPAIISLSCALVSLLYCIFYGVLILTEYVLPGTGLDGAYLFNTLTSLSIFADGAAPLIIASAIPMSVGIALRSDHRLPRIILWASAAIDCAFLALSGSSRLLSVAAAAVFLTVIVCGSKWGFAALGAIIAAAAAFIFVGGFQNDVISYYGRAFSGIIGKSREFFDTVISLPAKDMLFGSGDAAGAAGANFFSRMILSFGVVGFILFCLFFAAVAVITVVFFITSAKAEKKRDVFERFAAVSSSSDTRLGVTVPLSGALVIIAGGLFTDVFGNASLYMLLWTYFGIWFAYRRSAQKEISKALDADSGQHSGQSAEIKLSFR